MGRRNYRTSFTTRPGGQESAAVYHQRRMFEDRALSLAFFLSGAAGLIFQVVWFYRASLVLGSSLWAVSIVLSAFMAGLALGNGLAPSLVRRWAKPLLGYAALEGVIGVSGVAVAALLPALTVVTGPIGHAFCDRTLLVNVCRLLAAFTILVVPATAIGATFPVLMAGAAGRDRRFGQTLGRFYGLNTIGAVAGVIVSETVLIRAIGVGSTARVAGLLNFGAAALAYMVSRRGAAVRAEAPSRSPRRSGGAWPLLLSAFLAGAGLLGLEVVWFRFLSLYVLSTTLATSMMLAVVLGAIGVGALAAGRWCRRHDTARGTIAIVALTAGLAVLSSYAGFDRLTDGTEVGDWPRVLWFAVILTGPAAFCSGALFTLLGSAIRQHDRSDADTTARVTLANTSGATVAPLLTTFGLLPLVGVEGSIVLAALLYAAIAGITYRLDAGSHTSQNGWLSALAVALVLGVAGLEASDFRDRYFARAASVYAEDGSRIVATREGPAETIFLMQQQWLGQPVYNRLVTNGFSMSGTAVPGMRYMRYFAYWPMLVHRGPIRRALLVCYGVGVTAGAVLQIPGLESLDVAEISRDVVAMSDVIYRPSEHPLHDPRVRLHIEDGRYLLSTTDDHFDLITGEPPPPRTPGSVNIYTREYFRLIYDHLTEGGIATYWVPVARPRPGTDVDTIVRAFCDVFADCALWNGTPFDLMLTGSRHGTGPIDTQTFASAWTTPGLQASMREVGFERPEQIGATFIGDATFLKELTANTPPLTDDFPDRLRPDPSRPSLSDPRTDDPAAADRFRRIIDTSRARSSFESSPYIRAFWADPLRNATLPYFDAQRLLNSVIWDGAKPLTHLDDLHRLLTSTSLRTLPLWLLGSDEVKQRIAETHDDGSGAVEYARALRGLSGRDYRGAAGYFARAEERGLRAPTLTALRAFALTMDGQRADAAALLDRTPPQTPDEVAAWRWLRGRISPQ
jgi:spermidine synthase